MRYIAVPRHMIMTGKHLVALVLKALIKSLHETRKIIHDWKTTDIPCRFRVGGA